MKKITVVLLLNLFLLSSSLVANAAPSFTDVKNHWAKESINRVVELGLMKGYADNTFGAKKNITREELAAILSRMVEDFDIRAKEFPSDIAGRWSEAVITHCLALNLIEPLSANSFAPKGFATRQDIAHAINVLLELHQMPVESSVNKLNDIAGVKYQKDIQAIVSVGMMGGDANGNFYPNKNITRAELAAVLVRVHDKINGATDIEGTSAPLAPAPVAQKKAETKTEADPQNVKLVSGTKYIEGKFDRDIAYKVLALVNTERKKASLKELTWSETLLIGADIRAVEIAELFSHDRPDGTSCFTLTTELMAENIAEGHTSAEQVVRDWMNSAGHRANIMNPKYTKMAVSYFIDSKGVTHWAQHFS